MRATSNVSEDAGTTAIRLGRMTDPKASLAIRRDSTGKKVVDIELSAVVRLIILSAATCSYHLQRAQKNISALD